MFFLAFFSFNLIVFCIDNNMDEYYYLLYTPPAGFYLGRTILEINSWRYFNFIRQRRILNSSFHWQSYEKYCFGNFVSLISRIIWLVYMAITGIFLYFNIRFLTVLTIFIFVLLNSLLLASWCKQKDNKGSRKIITYSRVLISLMIDVELILASIKADHYVDLSLLAMLCLFWGMLPFCIASCIVSSVILISRICQSCKKKEERNLNVKFPFVVWVFVIFCGYPALFYVIVYNLSVRSTVYKPTPTLNTMYMILTVYSLITFILHLLIADSFRYC